jgi:hypothetical protein
MYFFASSLVIWHSKREKEGKLINRKRPPLAKEVIQDEPLGFATSSAPDKTIQPVFAVIRHGSSF